MNLRHIEVFRALMTKRTVSAAAQFLNVSQPGVSRLIRNLEERSAVRLFNRVKGRLEPTREAMILHEEVEGAFVRLERVRSLVARLAAMQSGLVRVVAAHTLAHTLVLDRLLSIRQHRPNLQLAVDYAPYTGIMRGIETGDFDFGIVIGEGPDRSFQHRHAATLAFTLAVPRGHRFARRKAVALRDLLSENVISYRRGSPLFLALAAQGMEAIFDASTIEVGSSLIACGAADRGWGLAVVDTDTIRRSRSRNLVEVPLSPALEIPVLVYFRKEVLSSPVARSVLAALCGEDAEARV